VVSSDPAARLSEASIVAGVSALSARNRHHLASMTEAEQAEAVAHWRELALAVLVAAATTETAAPEGAQAAAGRAVLVLQDVEADGVAVHASFHPELEDLGNGEVAGTPAQITALELLHSLGIADEPR